MNLKQKAFDIFHQMNAGEVIIISEFAKKDPESFIEYCKDWIDEGNWDYEFSSDWKLFRRMNFNIKIHIKPK